MLRLVGPTALDRLLTNHRAAPVYFGSWVTVSFLLALLFWLLAVLNVYDRTILQLLAIGETLLLVSSLINLEDAIVQPEFLYEVVIFRFADVFLNVGVVFLPLTLWRILRYPPSRRLDRLLIGISVLAAGITAYTQNDSISSVVTVLQFVFFLGLLIRKRNELQGAQWAIVVGTFVSIVFLLGWALVSLSGARGFNPYLIGTGYFLPLPVSLLVYVALRFKEIVAEDRTKAAAVARMTEEKRQLLTSQNERLEQQVEVRTAELNQSLTNLKSTQAQLVQKEKLASLGELTAGIAHEIQNPLNFVNNFAEVSVELVAEQRAALAKGDMSEVSAIADDLSQNLQKIHHHGGRASAIVKGMLEHARASGGEKQPTDLNAIVAEYLQIAYHGLRAKDKGFTCELVTRFDPAVGQVDLTPQEMGRVLLNLYNNAFYAVSQRQKQSDGHYYKPRVEVRTQREGQQVGVQVRDNGTGIVESVKDKIFQPFFTTKPTGEGTGLGLSLSYDIITKGHGGSLTVTSKAGEDTAFVIQLPALS